jgi:dissimilatory sulfite reductase related protein
MSYKDMRDVSGVLLLTYVKREADMSVPQRSPQFDQDGFLVSGEHWSEQLARELAVSSGIPALTDDHWRVLYYLRENYYDSCSLPPERIVCHALGLPEHCEQKLFGNDLKRAWRIAGLPNPGEEAKAYMGQGPSNDS